MEKIRVLRIDPLEEPEIIEIDNDLDTLHEIIGCELVQAVYPWLDPVGVLVDDCGKLKGCMPNRVLENDEGEPYDILVGTVLITGLTEDDFGSLSDELAEKYAEKFRYPELFFRSVDDQIVVFKMGSSEEPRILV